MTVVLDTNVVVSGLFLGGLPRAILDLLADGAFKLAVSPSILDEYQPTYDRLGAGHPELQSRQPLLDLLTYGTLVPDSATQPGITKDPTTISFCCARAMPAPSSSLVIGVFSKSRGGSGSRFSPLAPSFGTF